MIRAALFVIIIIVLSSIIGLWFYVRKGEGELRSRAHLMNLAGSIQGLINARATDRIDLDVMLQSDEFSRAVKGNATSMGITVAHIRDSIEIVGESPDSLKVVEIIWINGDNLGSKNYKDILYSDGTVQIRGNQ